MSNLVQIITDNIAARLARAGIDTNGVHILGPGGTVAPEWGDQVFEAGNYPGWRLVIEAPLTVQQRDAITAAMAVLDATDYPELVQDEARAAFAALPELMRTGTIDQIAAYYASVPHGTTAQWMARQEAFTLYLCRAWVVSRDAVMAQYRADKLRGNNDT